MGFAFHVEVAIGAGESDYAATAGTEPNEAVTAQRVNVDPKSAFDVALPRLPGSEFAPRLKVECALWKNAEKAGRLEALL